MVFQTACMQLYTTHTVPCCKGEGLTSQVYLRPDLVPTPLQVEHCVLRCKESFLHRQSVR